LIEQDPNGISDLEKHECRTANDYTDWSKLSSDPVTRKMTPEEMKKYHVGEWRNHGKL